MLKNVILLLLLSLLLFMLEMQRVLKIKMNRKPVNKTIQSYFYFKGFLEVLLISINLLKYSD